MTDTRVCFLGMGVMGAPMASHVARAGIPTTVYNRTRGKADAWAEQYQGEVADTPADAVRDANIVLMCLGNDQSVEDVLTSEDGAMQAMRTVFA